MRRSTLLSNSILPATLLLSMMAACGGDGGSSEPATFLTSSEAQRQRAIMAAAGGDAGLAYITGVFAATATDATQCPTVERSGDTVTATFDCSDESGQRIDGRIIATNVASIFDEEPTNDPTKPAVVELQGYHQHGATAAEAVRLDGKVTLLPTGALVAELDATLMGIAVFTDATLTGNGELASATEGSMIDVDGLGSATIHGAWSLDDENPAGALELRGADVLKADFAEAFGGCVPIYIDGNAAGQICEASPAE
jgi:hypothetical protein